MRSATRIISATAVAVAMIGGGGLTYVAMADKPKPTVAVIGMGGTIAGKAESRADFETYKAGHFPIADLIDDLQPEIGELAEVESEDFGRGASGEYTIADYKKLSLLVDRRLRTKDAVVVSSGTASMEELAYFLHLTVRSTKPVVVTGAMRPWNVLR